MCMGGRVCTTNLLAKEALCRSCQLPNSSHSCGHFLAAGGRTGDDSGQLPKQGFMDVTQLLQLLPFCLAHHLLCQLRAAYTCQVELAYASGGWSAGCQGAACMTALHCTSARSTDMEPKKAACTSAALMLAARHYTLMAICSATAYMHHAGGGLHAAQDTSCKNVNMAHMCREDALANNHLIEDCGQGLISFVSHILVGMRAFHVGELVHHVMVVSQQVLFEPGGLHTGQFSTC